MKVMLINPALHPEVNSNLFSRFATPVPPAGIAYIAAVLEKSGIGVVVIDQFANKMSNEELLKKIVEEMPQIIGFSCLTPTMDNVRFLVKRIKDIRRSIQIVLGNIHATVFADKLLKEGMADIIVYGEGEFSMLELTLALEQKVDLGAIKGISFVRDGKIYHNPERESIRDIDVLPYPAWHLLELKYYRKAPLLAVYELALPIQASRGCPYRCTFCAQEKIYKKPRHRNIKKVVDEVEFLHKKFKVNCFIFIDAYFPFSIASGLEFCSELIRRGLHERIKWVTETRVDKVDLKLLKTMKEAGIHLIMYGFEVGNQMILDSMKKKATLHQARKAMEDTREAGILTLGLFILGMPGESKETCEETIKFAKEIDCDIAKFNTAVPLPGSEFFEYYRNKFGDIQKPEKFTSWYGYKKKASHSGELIYAPEGMTNKELVSLQKKAMFQFYIRSKLIIRHIVKRTITFKDLFYGAYLLTYGYLKTLISPFARKIR